MKAGVERRRTTLTDGKPAAPPSTSLSHNAKAVTDDCPSKKLVMPLYVEGGEFVQPFCCYGNDVDCDLCGGWEVFHLAAQMERGAEQRAGDGLELRREDA